MRAWRVIGWTVLGGGAAYLGTWAVTSLAVMAAVRRARDGERPVPVPGIRNFAHVDERLWRGGAPAEEGYRWLVERGVRTVVDLRAEAPPGAARSPAGLTVVRLPVPDGRAPSPEQVRRFLAEVERARGRVFVHCGAGVGRTGCMAAAYLVRTGRAYAGPAMTRSLAVGPPSVEQISFMRRLDDRLLGRLPAAVVAFSQVADSPRRVLAGITARIREGFGERSEDRMLRRRDGLPSRG